MADVTNFAVSAISISTTALISLVAVPLGAFLVAWGVFKARIEELRRELTSAQKGAARAVLHDQRLADLERRVAQTEALGPAVAEHGPRLKTVEAEVERLRDHRDRK